MEDFVKRIKEEREELRIRLNKLSTFMFSDKWDSLTLNEKLWLEEQRSAMFAYFNVLTKRLDYYTSQD